MKKIALLVETGFFHRVVIDVDDDFSNDDLLSEKIQEAVSKEAVKQINNLTWSDVYENIASIEEDIECPADSI